MIRVRAWTETRDHRPLFTDFTLKNRGRAELLCFDAAPGDQRHTTQVAKRMMLAVTVSQLHEQYQRLQGPSEIEELEVFLLPDGINITEKTECIQNGDMILVRGGHRDVPPPTVEACAPLTACTGDHSPV